VSIDLGREDRGVAADPREVLDREASPPDLVVSYADRPDAVIDIRLPDHRADTGAVIVLWHGGFWRAEYDRVHTRPLADGLASLGAVVLTPEFRRTGQPGGGWPGTFDDVAAAMDAIPVALAAAGRDPDSSVVLVGHSAGGHLAIWAAARHRQDPASAWFAPAGPVCGVVALAPVADLKLAARLDLDEGAVRVLLGGGAAEVPERFAAADPTRLLPVDVPVAVLHGTEDRQVPLEVGRAFADAAVAAGDDLRFDVLEGHEHFALIDPLSDAWPALRAALAWVTSRS
jgi:acetyl esterase/lipase